MEKLIPLMGLIPKLFLDMVSSSPADIDAKTESWDFGAWNPFLEWPGNFSGPKAIFSSYVSKRLKAVHA